MPIQQYLPVSRSLVCDGSDKDRDVTLDFEKECAAVGAKPTGVADASGGGEIEEAALSGTEVTFKWKAPPPAGAFTVGCKLLFDCCEPKKKTQHATHHGHSSRSKE